MRKTILYIATSLDGYIADEYGSVDWLEVEGIDHKKPSSFDDFIDTIDTVILGYKTYHQIITELSPNQWVYEGKQSYVFTHHQCENQKEIEFVSGDIGSFIDKLKQQAGKDIWICGGAELIQQCLKVNKIDRIHLTLIPCLLGKGIKLFNTLEASQQFKLVEYKNYQGLLDVVYERI